MTNQPPPGVPTLGFAHYIGTGERFIRVTAYFIFAVVTGVLMTLTNILLHACESILDLVLNLASVPDQVNNVITANNIAILDVQEKKLDEEIGAKECLEDMGEIKPDPPFLPESRDV